MAVDAVSPNEVRAAEGLSPVEPETDAKVVSEPLTYRRESSDVSYFKDVIDYQRGVRGLVEERLGRHQREVQHELRVHPDRVQGAGGYFAPPIWLMSQFANVPLPGRVLANDIPTFPLPKGGQSINVPVLATGPQATIVADDGSVTMTDITDTSTSSTVVAIAGYVDPSQQLLDQSPQGAHLDQVIGKALLESYNATLEYQLFNGSGTSGQLLGILNMPTGAGAVNPVTYTDASPTGTELFTYLGQAVAGIGINRKQPPEKWYMNTPRQAWIATSEDSQSRPLMLAGMTDPGEFQLVQYPVRLSDAIPRNLGTGTNQDAIVLCKPSDMLLLESDPHMRVMTDIASDTDSSSAGTLTVRIELHRYVAAILGRYPTGIAVIQGTGLITQTGF